MNRTRSGISNGHLTESKEDTDTGTVGCWARGLHPSHKVEEDLWSHSTHVSKGANREPDLSDTQKLMPLMKAVPLVPNIPVSQAVLTLEQTAVPKCVSIEMVKATREASLASIVVGLRRVLVPRFPVSTEVPASSQPPGGACLGAVPRDTMIQRHTPLEGLSKA